MMISLILTALMGQAFAGKCRLIFCNSWLSFGLDTDRALIQLSQESPMQVSWLVTLVMWSKVSDNSTTRTSHFNELQEFVLHLN